MAYARTRKKRRKRKKPPLGSGQRFKQVSNSLQGKVDNPDAVAAAIGRKKYGSKRMAAMSAAGRRRRQ